MIENIIAAAIVAIVAILFIRGIYHALTGRGKGCACCGTCKDCNDDKTVKKIQDFGK